MSILSIKIESSRLNLPDDATQEAATAALEARLGKGSAVEAERDVWKKDAQEAQTELVKMRASMEQAVAKKRDLVIQAAIDGGRIAAAQKVVAEKIYDSTGGPDLFDEWVKSQERAAYLMTKQSLSGPFLPPAADPEMELAQVVAELTANHKDMTRPQAVMEAYKRDKTLYARVQAAKQAKVLAERGAE